MTVTENCVHCGRELEITEETAEVAREHTAGRIACSSCRGMHELPEGVPPCDFHDCEDPAPFTISTKTGPIHRCRAHLIEDLQRGWHEFYDETPEP